MESPALLLSSSSSSSSSLSCSAIRSCSLVPHSHAVLHFASRSLFARPSLVRLRTRATSAGADAEEQRWIREEQRWLREEQRWLREEKRWQAEQRLMADEVALLKREVEQLRTQVQDRRSLPSVVASLKQLVKPFPVEEPRPEIEFVEEEAKEEDENAQFASSVSISDHPESMVSSFSAEESSLLRSPSIPSMSEFSIDLMTEAAPSDDFAPMQQQPRTELRKGAEGDEVQALQEALEELGFYSGEEDIEYSMFAEGTETAMKSWQASIGMREDGVASLQALAILFGAEKASPSSNGRTFPTEQPDLLKAPMGSEVERNKTFAEDKRDVENTQDGDIAANRRVFLLGENRWEEPRRLAPTASNGARPASPSSRPTISTTSTTSTTATGEEQCFSCKGDGVCMCTECEGTGELNVEDQFLDWLEEGAKCPYCEGSGAIPCDVCLGRGAVPAPV